MTSKILLENLKIYSYHGVLPEEKIIGTYIEKLQLKDLKPIKSNPKIN